jgi:hypothetical protein
VGDEQPREARQQALGDRHRDVRVASLQDHRELGRPGARHQVVLAHRRRQLGSHRAPCHLVRAEAVLARLHPDVDQQQRDPGIHAPRECHGGVEPLAEAAAVEEPGLPIVAGEPLELGQGGQRLVEGAPQPRRLRLGRAAPPAATERRHDPPLEAVPEGEPHRR